MQKKINISETKVINTNRVMPNELNGHKTMFGGKILSLIDRTASISVNHVTKEPIATVSLDEVNFIAPLHQNDIYTLTCYASGIYNRSVEVFFKIFGRDQSKEDSVVKVTGFITFALLTKVEVGADLIASTSEEKYILAGFKERLAKRKQKLNNLKTLKNNITAN
ncbi:acyl-CoA thioesterase [Xylocopilactobacillus apis]|uniref:Acyl-CoA thioesterase n=1 Tax=Xylocopilactobacillus apis TaxID=2932183 RepID=A0AAU9D3U6_9LACO|nr:hotdog domain-containing protein [Xylocopilactobacillus apis]BDR57206.1 acyl-CoA thioesterase [Xylocopilactobacillus apis]